MLLGVEENDELMIMLMLFRMRMVNGGRGWRVLMLILNMDEEVDVYYLWQRGGGRGGTWGDNAAWEENAGAGENAKQPQSFASSIQPVL